VPPGADVDARDTIAQNPALDDLAERRRRR
jgi:hypothetical protein